MRVPVIVKIGVLTLGATAFYTWVGQLVPQKEVLPPQVVQMSQDISTEEMVRIGDGIFHGKGLCSTCHTIGQGGAALRFPDLDGVAVRASNRVPGLDQLQYFAQTLYRPNAYIVPGFNPGMPEIDKPPIGLSDDEIKAVIAFLQTLGGKPTITMATTLPYSEAAHGAAPGEMTEQEASSGGSGSSGETGGSASGAAAADGGDA